MSDSLTTRFGAESTAAEAIDGIDLSGRRAIVTGGASGLGVETARALAGAGAEVTLAVRNVEAGAKVAQELSESTGNAAINVAELNLADQKSVAAFVVGWEGPLHILINNAGIMMSPLDRTPEGWELQFATNHIGHFALALGLHPALAQANGARIVALSSPAHLAAPVDFDDLDWTSRAYDPSLAYGMSKSANVLFAVEATTRWAGDGIVANAVAPGSILTNLQRYMPEETLNKIKSMPIWKTPEQGAATTVLVATSPEIGGVGGRYFEDCQEAGLNEPGTRRGVAAHALDPESATRLWKVSTELVRA
jgi:NAD(P)-dependent dehydrogenase (short-subunit alcohol dehydrogenase family)